MDDKLSFMELAAILRCLYNESVRNRKIGLETIMAKVINMMSHAEISLGEET